MHRMAEPSRSVFSQYPNYGPYGSSPFGNMNQMHMSQYRNQMTYSIPAQGGLPYLMPGYPELYMGNLPPRYRSSGENQPEKNQNRNDPESVQSLASEKSLVPKNDSMEQRAFSEKRK
jgi:hypothetical protein